MPLAKLGGFNIKFAQEAKEILEDGEGRWFSFRATANTVVILEKKELPSHLQDLPCVDSPTKLATVLHELQDAGEVGPHTAQQCEVTLTSAILFSSHIFVGVRRLFCL